MIMQLVVERKLKLSETLDKYFLQIPNAHKIRIMQMLLHRSGIPNITRNSDPQRNWANGITKDELLALIAKATPYKAILQQFRLFHFKSYP